MPNLRLGRNAFDDAVISATSEATGASSPWLATHLQNPARDSSHRTIGLTSQSLLLNWGGQSRDISWICIPRHKLHGASWHPTLHTNTTGSSLATGGDPLGGATACVPVLTLPNGFTWGLDPTDKRNTDLNYYKPATPIIVWLPAPITCKSVLVQYSGTPEQFGTNLAYYQATRIMGGKHLEVGTNVSQTALDRALKDLTTAVRSGGGSNRRTAGETYRSLTFDLDWIDDAVDRAALIDFIEDAGTSRSFLLSFFPTAGGRLERDYTFVGTSGGDTSVGVSWPLYKSKLVFVED